MIRPTYWSSNKKKASRAQRINLAVHERFLLLELSDTRASSKKLQKAYLINSDDKGWITFLTWRTVRLALKPSFVLTCKLFREANTHVPLVQETLPVLTVWRKSASSTSAANSEQPSPSLKRQPVWFPSSVGETTVKRTSEVMSFRAQSFWRKRSASSFDALSASTEILISSGCWSFGLADFPKTNLLRRLTSSSS